LKMKILLLVLCLLGVLITNVRPAYGTSVGYERYQDDKCEIYLEYFPIFPTDSRYPTASEEFVIKFYVWQKDWWEYLVCHLVPWGFTIEVFFRDDTCENNNWITWKRWYPISMSQHGLKVS